MGVRVSAMRELDGIQLGRDAVRGRVSAMHGERYSCGRVSAMHCTMNRQNCSVLMQRR